MGTLALLEGMRSAGIGSLVLAFSEEEEILLVRLLENGRFNSVPDLRILSRREIPALEPAVNEKARAALYLGHIAAADNAPTDRLHGSSFRPRASPERIQIGPDHWVSLESTILSNTQAASACSMPISSSSLAR